MYRKSGYLLVAAALLFLTACGGSDSDTGGGEGNTADANASANTTANGTNGGQGGANNTDGEGGTTNGDGVNAPETINGEGINAPDDGDGDGVPNAGDNCPNAANLNQWDGDGDGVGNACDSTFDGIVNSALTGATGQIGCGSSPGNASRILDNGSRDLDSTNNRVTARAIWNPIPNIRGWEIYVYSDDSGNTGTRTLVESADSYDIAQNLTTNSLVLWFQVTAVYWDPVGGTFKRKSGRECWFIADVRV